LYLVEEYTPKRFFKIPMRNRRGQCCSSGKGWKRSRKYRKWIAHHRLQRMLERDYGVAMRMEMDGLGEPKI
jgi:hypothetical protein